MVTVTKKDASTLEAERDALARELRGTQEMLAHVLLAVNEPVVVEREMVERGLPDTVQIRIDEDLEKESFVFYLQEVTDETA